MAEVTRPYIQHIAEIQQADLLTIKRKDAEYGGSWCRRGGVGAGSNIFRKWDRIEVQLEKNGYDIFKAVIMDNRPEGLLDDLRDLRNYLTLVEAYLQETGAIEKPKVGHGAFVHHHPHGYNAEEEVILRQHSPA